MPVFGHLLWTLFGDSVSVGHSVVTQIIGGGGYYHRQERFFETQEAFDRFFGPFPVNVEVRQDDDAGGVNIGAGLTWNWGMGNKILCVEARYHHIFTPGGDTEIIPVTFGFRW